MRDVFICDAVRTPIGRFGGAFVKEYACHEEATQQGVKAFLKSLFKLN